MVWAASEPSFLFAPTKPRPLLCAANVVPLLLVGFGVGPSCVVLHNADSQHDTLIYVTDSVTPEAESSTAGTRG